MKHFSMLERIRYGVDNLFARGAVAQILALAVVTAFFIFFVSLVVVATGVGEGPASAGPDLPEMIWRSLLRTLDPGTMGGDSGAPAYLAASLFITLVGIFIVSILIGILTSGIERRLESLRRGRSLVVERDHIVVLGWSGQIFSVLNELMEANASRRNACLVVMADLDKPEMEEQIAARVPRKGRTRIVCRRGNPMDMTDVEIVNPGDARSILILSPEADDPDLQVIKCLLALVNRADGRSGALHIVAQISDARNLEAARMVGGEQAHLVLEGDLISRIMVQTCRQSGLSLVYSELLNFAGDEIYSHAEPSLSGRTFAEARLAYEKAAPIGLRRAADGVVLNPPGETRIGPGDMLVLIAEDDSTMAPASATLPALLPDAMAAGRTQLRAPEHTLILGWNHRGISVVRELDAYSSADSHVLVVADDEGVQAQIERDLPTPRHVQLTVRRAETTDRRTLAALDIPSFSHVMVLAYEERLGAQQADAATLLTLLHLREIREHSGKHFSVVSEMLDLRNRQLAEIAHADDYIVSEHLVSLVMAQIAENRDLRPVFDDLFDPAGSEIYLKPAADYVQLARAVDFYTVTASAGRHGETAIGYRLARHSGDAARSYGVTLNPRKSEPLTFESGDKIIVLAES